MPLVDLTFRPNRSLPRRHSAWLVGGLGLLVALGCLRFLALGAWPVVPFLVADVALLAWAFRASYRAGAAFEEVRLDDAMLTVRKVSAAGAERRFRLEPFWARVRLEEISEQENRLWLTSKAVRVRVAECLSPQERVAVHRVIADGLARWKDGRAATF